MPGKSLGKEEISRCPIHVRDSRVSQSMEGEEAAESCSDLPIAEDDLNPSLRNPLASLVVRTGAPQSGGSPQLLT